MHAANAAYLIITNSLGIACIIKAALVTALLSGSELVPCRLFSEVIVSEIKDREIVHSLFWVKEETTTVTVGDQMWFSCSSSFYVTERFQQLTSVLFWCNCSWAAMQQFSRRGCSISIKRCCNSSVKTGCNSSIKKGCNSSIKRGCSSSIRRGCSSINDTSWWVFSRVKSWNWVPQFRLDHIHQAVKTSVICVIHVMQCRCPHLKDINRSLISCHMVVHSLRHSKPTTILKAGNANAVIASSTPKKRKPLLKLGRIKIILVLKWNPQKFCKRKIC